MKISASELLNELKNNTQQHLEYAEELLSRSEYDLNYRPSPGSWSPLECLEHLNRYGAFYIPEISHRISLSKKPSKPFFKSGILGNYFANMMLPKEKVNRMKTLKEMNPIHSPLDKSVISEFIKQQQSLLELLENAKYVDLEKTKTSISISKLIKLKLGDTFSFVIYHNARHIAQAERILKSL